jgi:hypothetical protein
VEKSRRLVNKERKPLLDGLIIYFWWNVWKERNRRTFNHERKSFEEVVYLTREEFQQFQLATHTPGQLTI